MIKRLLDIILSTISILVLSIFFIPIIIGLKLTGEHKVFYTQKRLGKNRKTFGLLKFATMLENSPNLGTGFITTENDPRVLPFGKFLRKTKLNELPQIFNIFLGDMSIVGPRPLVEKHVDYIPNEFRKEVLSIQPGLTGIGYIVFRAEEAIFSKYSDQDPNTVYKELIAPYKAELEIWYNKNKSTLLDFAIIFFTAWVIFFKSSRLYRLFFKNLPPLPKKLIV